jgi:methylated-DNA-[protein]-cysteine S-methyltransferase
MTTNDLNLKGLATARATDDRARGAARRLADAAAAQNLIDVSLATTDSPIGELLLAVTPRGLARVVFEDEDRDAAFARIARELSPRILEHPAAADEARRQLDEYFGGARTRFELRLDRRLIHGIARDVLTATARVPFGRTTTYGEIAGTIGHPKAARAVGNALGSNPIPIVVPCHRVLRTGGALGGYAGGLDRKEELLRLEGVIAV